MLNKQKTDAIALLIQGLKQKEVCRVLGIEQSTLSKWMNKNQEFIEAYKAEMNKIMLLGSSKAYQKMEELLECENDSVVFKAAKDILDRAGFSATSRFENVGDTEIVVSFIGDNGELIKIAGDETEEEDEE